MNGSLTQRKKHLQSYLTALMLQLNDRLPTELLHFLGVQEQKALGFNSLELLHNISQINLKDGNPQIGIK